MNRYIFLATLVYPDFKTDMSKTRTLACAFNSQSAGQEWIKQSAAVIAAEITENHPEIEALAMAGDVQKYLFEDIGAPVPAPGLSAETRRQMAECLKVMSGEDKGSAKPDFGAQFRH